MVESIIEKKGCFGTRFLEIEYQTDPTFELMEHHPKIKKIISPDRSSKPISCVKNFKKFSKIFLIQLNHQTQTLKKHLEKNKKIQIEKIVRKKTLCF